MQIKPAPRGMLKIVWFAVENYVECALPYDGGCGIMRLEIENL